MPTTTRSHVALLMKQHKLTYEEFTSVDYCLDRLGFKWGQFEPGQEWNRLSVGHAPQTMEVVKLAAPDYVQLNNKQEKSFYSLYAVKNGIRTLHVDDNPSSSITFEYIGYN
jgi:hypothetical protein